ncbi:chromosome partitioning protein ParB [Chlamydia muridarum str. Nigg]|uniref:Probable chromosome-partitioning protein ParB n=2 Tax=Chlamydia muridarum TaxID=83560 RepID=PARB_CHLMU|nr:ParB/RepB/Spo0J family partition protein [Chlamydia muridarum]Q9PLN9.1 RecName: Full=Probable chromosome-partitioning protein ParB [Chlamydia muridarum str. Nigg]AAF38945.1 chromosome partioning protein, ParB family [Chlamydia muridarum str. Nigg]AHH22460.1 chromosome partitioning protein ParB [Chlamydia muridarum str. Nigg3 CMUT3-5]AHH23384.1 chromosome partitioning protein ParB [Chlamydia muridarum str. Nigg CM972]AID37611.1 chromosome partitioning protein ParB [Chlamydia muridarum str. N
MSKLPGEDTLLEVNIDDIRVSPFQPRRIFFEEDLKELILSIKAVGLIHPPVVREIRNGDKVLYYELIAGERRWRALQSAGYKTIPVVLKQVLADDLAAEATLIENIQRVNLNPLEMAEAFRRLIVVFGLTQDKVAKKVGKKRSTVANYLRLFSLSNEIQEKINSGELTLGHAKVILSLEDESLRQILSEKIISSKLAVREAEIEAKRLLKGKEDASKKEASLQKTSCLVSYQERLATTFGYPVTVKPQGKRICVSFFVEGEEALESLEKALTAGSFEVTV